MKVIGLRSLACAAVLIMTTFAAKASAELVLSQVIVDFGTERPAREDVEVYNSGSERLYVSAEPFEILMAGQPGQQRVAVVDPAVSGILVTPQRIVLEPGERRLIRIAMTGPRSEQDRVYRVTIKPVAGAISAQSDALKVFVGYDALVLYRAAQISGRLSGTREGHRLIIKNESNTAHELSGGEQCDNNGVNCQSLPGRRLYPGMQFEQAVPYDTPVSYRVSGGGELSQVRF
jgi:P pilus assembly chaperone PapD